MSGIPTLDTIPGEIVAGDTVKWTKALADFPVSLGWTLTYRFAINDGSAMTFNVAATQYGDSEDYLVSLPGSATSGKTAGTYAWAARVSDGSDSYTVEEGTIVLRAPLTAATDTRSAARKIVDAIDAALAGSTDVTIMETRIRDRMVKTYTTQELTHLRAHYKAILNSEADAEAIKRGRYTSRKVYTRF